MIKENTATVVQRKCRIQCECTDQTVPTKWVRTGRNGNDPIDQHQQHLIEFLQKGHQHGSTLDTPSLLLVHYSTQSDTKDNGKEHHSGKTPRTKGTDNVLRHQLAKDSIVHGIRETDIRRRSPTRFDKGAGQVINDKHGTFCTIVHDRTHERPILCFRNITPFGTTPELYKSGSRRLKVPHFVESLDTQGR